MSARAVRYGVFCSIFKNWICRASFRRRIFKPRADRRQRATKNALVSLSGRHYNAYGYALGDDGRRKSTRDEPQGRAFIPSPLWRENSMDYFVY